MMTSSLLIAGMLVIGIIVSVLFKLPHGERE